MYWNEDVFMPDISGGYVHLYKNSNGSQKGYSSISMDTENAVVLPELISMCVAVANDPEYSK